MELLGRQQVICQTEIEQLSDVSGLRPAIVEENHFYCNRCGTLIDKNWQLPNGHFYCGACIRFGRITTNDVLAYQLEKATQPREVVFTWQGELTSPQQEVSKKIVKSYQKKQHAMIWAVTGSGKTEMIFPVIQHVLEQGGRVGVTSPRIDVCRELYPRISEVFPDEDPLLLYGDSEEKYRYSHLTICTTHQMMHFYQAFDLLIVDEIDAFPYEGNPQLRFALQHALKTTGQYVYLTATPPNKLLEEIKEEFQLIKLPIRYHQRPLIVPEILFYEHWQSCYQQKWKLRKLLRYLKQLTKDNAVLVFCPSIAYMEKIYQVVKSQLSNQQIACVSSQDEAREEKVQKMREKHYQILFCTTILERGVTFENVSVIVMGANHPVFSKSALVQIAGRVDRKGDYNYGRVIFFFNQQTKDIRKACKEIQEMNQLAKRWQTNEV